MDERPTSWNHQYEQLNIPLSPNYQPWGGLFWGDGGETWTRKSGGWSPPTQLPSHLPLLQCYPGVLPHPTVQYITTIKLQINFRIGVVWLILVSRYSIKVAHLMHILFIYRVYINIYLTYTYMIYKQGYSVSLHLSTHLFAYWLEQMRHIEEHIQPRLSLSLSSTCHLPGDKGKEGLWLINNLPANSYPPVNWGNTGEKQVTNSGWLWPMMNWHFLFLFLNSMSVVDQL